MSGCRACGAGSHSVLLSTVAQCRQRPHATPCPLTLIDLLCQRVRPNDGHQLWGLSAAGAAASASCCPGWGAHPLCLVARLHGHLLQRLHLLRQRRLCACTVLLHLLQKHIKAVLCVIAATAVAAGPWTPLAVACCLPPCHTAHKILEGAELGNCSTCLLNQALPLVVGKVWQAQPPKHLSQLAAHFLHAARCFRSFSSALRRLLATQAAQ